jgi:hypothetical protein
MSLFNKLFNDLRVDENKFFNYFRIIYLTTPVSIVR